MSQVEFDYNNVKTIIQCNPNDKMKDIIKKFFIKVDTMESKVYFLYDGTKLDEELTFNEASKQKNKITVVVKEEVSEKGSVSSLKKSKNIICPECNENARISIDGYKISLYECKNGHRIKDIQLNEFEKTQYIDQAKIICDICKNKNKSETFENKFFICFSCKMNLCPLCQSIHDKSHYILDYEQKDYICKEHYEAYIYYCSDCKKDICTLCENGHNGHKIITYGSIMPDAGAVKKELNNLKERIYEFKYGIKKIISKLNSLMENLDNYCKLYNDMLKNFDIRKRNYSILQNINDIKNYNNNLMKDITEIINDKNIKTKFKYIIDMGDKMAFKEKETSETINENEEKTDNTENKKEDNNIAEENNNKNEEDDNNDNIKKYNPLDDKYENFEIDKIKELQSFTTKYDNKNLLILNDRRILSYQKYFDESGQKLFKICVYNLNNGIICDINIDTKEVYDIYQMNDGNLILSDYDRIKIIKIKRKSIEEIPLEEEINSDHIYKLSKEKLLFRNYRKMYIYSYENGKLIDKKKNIQLKDHYYFNNLCEINENEIAIYYTKDGKIFGYNAFIMFYDINKNKEIKTLKLGDGDDGSKLFLANKNNLIVDRNSKLVLIDVNSKNIKKEFKYDHSFDIAIRLNENLFLIADYYDIYQYEFENDNKIQLKKQSKNIEFDFIRKYPDNKLIIANGKKISIYG